VILLVVVLALTIYWVAASQSGPVETSPAAGSTPAGFPAGTLGDAPAPGQGPLGMPPPPEQGFTIYFIDVAQGDATLVVDRSGASLLVDAGRSQRRIRDRLRSLKVKDLDAVAVTHPDSDHIGGLPEVLDLYSVERIYLNGGTSDSQIFRELTAGVAAEEATVMQVSRGDVIPLGGLQLRVLHPGPLSGDSNADSMVLLVSCGAVSVLLTGDAEIPSERAMLAAGVLGDVDVLKVGHHGSRTSTSPEFLAQVRPEAGVISAGVGNSYGHPHPEVVERLTAAKVQLQRTDTTSADNTLALTSDCHSYQFQPAAAPAG
jgi:beta-lactamase superfamily II metal-dependent hydrolase